MTMMPIAEQLRAKLMQAFQPSFLELQDQSAAHQGHAGHDGRGESHFKLTIQAEAFAGLSRVAAHRLIMGVLAAELASRVHALQIVILPLPVAQAAAGAAKN
jgi:BolA family transcriptional regulator, general stress-responsive regulator